MYAKTKGDQLIAYPYTLADLKRDHPDVSFSEGTRVEELARYGVFAVVEDAIPEVGEMEALNKLDPVLEGGSWVRKFEVVALADDGLREAVEARVTRSLMASDWTLLNDAGFEGGGWAKFRAQLRAILAQKDLSTIEWPDPPIDGQAEYELRLRHA